MNLMLFDIFAIGFVMIMFGALVTFSMVYLELGPAARLSGKRHRLLAVALGSGILAFLIKLIIIVTIAEFPQYTINQFLTTPKIATPITQEPVKPGPARYVWIELPETSRAVLPSSSATVERYKWKALPELAPAPAHNPTTPQKVALGERLFFDKSLSWDGTLSCASCHDLYKHAGADGRSTSLGIEQQTGDRNAPTVWNTAFQTMFFWDGRAPSLEEQAKGPLVNPVEMGMPSLGDVEQKVRAQEHYTKAFAEVFGKGTVITIEHIAKAIAAYERSLITSDTPYDRFVRGDIDALSPSQVRGMALFQTVGCITCHHGPNFSAASIFDGSMPQRIFPSHPIPEEQRYNLLLKYNQASDTNRGVWRVPSLRNVALTGPWLHNGAVTELEEVVRIMAAGQLGRAGRYLLWSDKDSSLREYNQPKLTDQEVGDIVAFLNALSSDRLLAAKKK